MTERQVPRQTKDFARSDALRDQLAGLGIMVEDHADGTSSWRWA